MDRKLVLLILVLQLFIPPLIAHAQSIDTWESESEVIEILHFQKSRPDGLPTAYFLMSTSEVTGATTVSDTEVYMVSHRLASSFVYRNVSISISHQPLDGDSRWLDASIGWVDATNNFHEWEEATSDTLNLSQTRSEVSFTVDLPLLASQRLYIHARIIEAPKTIFWGEPNHDSYLIYHGKANYLPEGLLPVHNLDTGLNYTTIQEAIDANETLDGDRIFVEEGVYYEELDVYKSLSLIGEDRRTTIIDGNYTAWFVVTIRASDVTITGFTIRRGHMTGWPSGGIHLTPGSSNNNIGLNLIEENGIGVLVSTSNNSVSSNIISSNRFPDPSLGVAVTSGHSNIIYSNTVLNCVYSIGLGHSTQNIIAENNVSKSYGGIDLHYSDRNYVSCNDALRNYCGIWIRDFSSNNTISGNNITNNTRGIWLNSSSNNRIFHNNLMNNTNQIYQEYSLDSHWDNGFEGNYWSNYTGADIDYDGIGNSWHEIDENNTDRYPLMGMFSKFKTTLEHSVQTICNSTITDFQFNGTAISFNVTGAADTDGFCRICIPKALMNDTFRVYVNGTEILPSPGPLPCSNTTHIYLYFSYRHSTQEVIVIPEFSSLIVLPIFMMITLLAAVICRRWRLLAVE